MEIIELRSPRPWRQPRPASQWDFQVSGILRASTVRQRRLGTLEGLLERRQSRRQFDAPLTVQQLGDLLWHAYRVRRRNRASGNWYWESRPCPSGGGAYPISVVSLQVKSFSKALLIYYARDHAFGVRELPSKAILRRALTDVDPCLKVGKGTLLWFVADIGWSGGRYQNPESLAWRDSGALLATVSLVAEGMGLNCCGLGMHEIPSVRRFLRLEKRVLGVGGCVIGSGEGSQPGPRARGAGDTSASWIAGRSRLSAPARR